MSTTFGQSVLSVFDVWEDSLVFLSEILESGQAPSDEMRHLFHQSLVGCAEDWHYLIDCARSIQGLEDRGPESLDGSDVVSFIWEIFNGSRGASPSPRPWEATDRLIALAKGLERDVDISPPSLRVAQESAPRRARPRVKKQRLGTTSHYWTDKPWTPTHKRHIEQSKLSTPPSDYHPRRDQALLPREAIHLDAGAALVSVNSAPETQSLHVLSPLGCSRLNNPRQRGSLCKPEKEGETPQIKRSTTKSPYFQQKTPPSSKQRPPPGTVSCIPFPPLDSPSFGIIQEELAHDSFWLLIAITFLIKTNGQLALPAFRRVRERFPTPSQLLEPSNEGELLDMIRHLGLSNVRLAFIQRYAKAFIERPPKAGVRYRVRNYDKRAVSPSLRDLGGDSEDPKQPHLSPVGGDQDLEAWEIGHMTQGKYAIDSWRIFCRDELLGRAEDWNGKGREPEFQPEWMRVKPADKELRACLRWMWMREGWEWDPATGERAVLREEMQRAVNEGRVEYDDAGALRILTEPRDEHGTRGALGI
ncbi:methyl- -binding domain-containing 4 [Trichoderma cornu-damae]|uniref:Methyl- -binding domain-containing 4 n=1 Tax=Trichoderma cornu-damae TaxID=654480 RepID=A0A9P8TZX7_9HYPO|nr:methyl- -binding domain-containing 4 [Trichoderma cornu-damae]